MNARGWKGIPLATLAEAGVTSEGRLVRVPYRAADGSVRNVRVFAANGRCWWEKKDLTLRPFGLETLRRPASDLGLLIAEGESDTLILRRWFRWGYDVLGVPGATSWRRTWRWYAEPYAVVYVLGDGDDAGRWFATAVRRDIPRARIVPIPDSEDARSLIQRDGPGAIDWLLEEADRYDAFERALFGDCVAA